MMDQLGAKPFLQNFGYEELTPMQERYLKETEDFTVLLSDTGSGKTLAFLLKFIAFQEANAWKSKVLIVSPTRELAIQLSEVFRKLQMPITSALCYGGHNFKHERLQLFECPQAVIGTPGRLLDHFERGTEGLAAYDALIVDEYDKTLEMGFHVELDALLRYAGKLKHIQLVSATPIEKIPDFLKDTTFKVSDFRSQKPLALTYKSIRAEENDKLKALAHLLSGMTFGPKIIFCTHRDAADRISSHLNEYGKENVLFHGGLDQAERERAVTKFKLGVVDCMIATDLASRGLDIPDIESVIHYQYPHTLEDFIHRNGRTARMLKSGQVYLLHADKEPLPDYLNDLAVQAEKVPERISDYAEGQLVLLYLNVGRRQKIRKFDVVGCLTQDIKIPFEHVTAIVVNDEYSYVALHKSSFIKHEKELARLRIKKMTAKMNLCR